MKKSPIEKDRDADLILMRKELLKIISPARDKPDSPAKEIVNAAKLLARMHSALQVDKTVQKDPEKEKKERELTETEKKVVDDALRNF